MAADTIRSPERVAIYGTETVYQYYFNLLEAHKRKFKYDLSQITNKCGHKRHVKRGHVIRSLDLQ
jgi:hypothetical protein